MFLVLGRLTLALATSSPRYEEAFRFVEANQAMHCARTMRRLLGVSTSGFYA